MRVSGRSQAAWWVAAVLSACGGTSVDAKLTSIHNTMHAMGWVQTGAIIRGQLAEEETVVVPVKLQQGRCHAFVLVGGDGVDEVMLRVLDSQGNEQQRTTHRGRQAAIRLCPERAGQRHIEAQFVSGSGDYVLSWWSEATGASQASGGACGAPWPLAFNEVRRGTTVDGTAREQGSCGPGDAPEHVYRVEVPHRARLRAELNSDFDAVLYLKTACGAAAEEIACNDDAEQGQRNRSIVDATVEAGTYLLFVDGFQGSAGDYRLVASLEELADLERICAAVPTLSPGQVVEASTEGGADNFQATCARGAHAPDHAYRIHIDQASRVRIRQKSEYDGSLHVRRTCTDPQSEVACNDDFGSERDLSLVTTRLDPGTYYVIADGFDGQSGQFSLSADVVPIASPKSSAEACRAPERTEAAFALEVDTFSSSDAFIGSCGGEGAPDRVFELRVRERSRLRVEVRQTEFPATLYLRRACDDPNSEVECVSGEAELTAIVAKGRYFLFVDGENEETFGSAQIAIELDSASQVERICRAAPVLKPGQTVTGSTRRRADMFNATCAQGSTGADAVYRIRLQHRTKVRLSLESNFDGVLYLRASCLYPESELACNDDEGDAQHSLIERTLEAGEYFVVVDGFQSGRGQFALTYEERSPE